MTPTDPPGESPGHVVHIHSAPEKRAPLSALERIRLVAGRGIEGDRNFGRAIRRNVTLVSEEELEDVCGSLDIPYRPGSTRRNITVRGVDLRALVGRTFRVGSAVLVGHELCEPCSLMETTVGPGAERALLHRAGIRARVLEGGDVAIGDRIVAGATAAPEPSR